MVLDSSVFGVAFLVLGTEPHKSSKKKNLSLYFSLNYKITALRGKLHGMIITSSRIDLTK